jgi:hypothetical protein
MDFFTSKRVVTTLVVFLVVLNVALLGVLWRQNSYRPQAESVTRQFNRQNPFTGPLALSEAQRISFEKLRKEHFSKVRPDMQAIELLKKQLVKEALNDKLDNKKIESLADSIGSRQATIEKELALHFHELAAICNPAQRDSLKTVLDRMTSHRFSNRRERGGLNHRQSRGMFNRNGIDTDIRK